MIFRKKIKTRKSEKKISFVNMFTTEKRRERKKVILRLESQKQSDIVAALSFIARYSEMPISSIFPFLLSNTVKFKNNCFKEVIIV
jgi:hypothetical protein